MARTPWDGKKPIASRYWMDWFNYFLGQGVQWEEAARRSWIEVERQPRLSGRLLLSVAEQTAPHHPEVAEQYTHFERPIARWTDPFSFTNGPLRYASWVSPWPDGCVCTAWTRRPQRLQIILDLHIDLLEPGMIDEAVEDTLDETRVLAAISALVSSALSRGYRAVCSERRVLERILRRALQEKITSPIFDVRIVPQVEASSLRS